MNDMVHDTGKYHDGAAYDASKQYVIYADADKCRACRKCELACIASHHHLTIKEAIKLRDKYEPRVHVVKTDSIKMPMQCRQCEDAPCARTCPTEALVQQAGGPIIMRSQFCAGCGLCIMACPYGAISRAFIHLSEDEKKRLERSEPRCIAVRCDLCSEWRVEEGKDNTSACVEACPAKALRMVPLQEYRCIMNGESMDHEVVGSFGTAPDNRNAQNPETII